VLKNLHALGYFRGKSSLTLMKEDRSLIPMSFVLHRSHILVEPYNEIIRRLRDAGITEHWITRAIRVNEKFDDIGPEVLTMEHLEVCFYVCMFPLIFAFLAFFGEISAELFKHIFKTLRDKISSSWKRRTTRHRIIQVRPIGYEREKTMREKISAAFESFCDAVESKIRKNRVKLPKQPKPVKLKLPKCKMSPKRSNKLTINAKNFCGKTKEKVASKIETNKTAVKAFLEEKFANLSVQ
jgi:hypothetical protein